MKFHSISNIFLRGVLYLLLIGQLWSNAFFYLSYYSQEDISIVELTDLEERNSEEEKEETDSKELQENRFSLGNLRLLSKNQLSDWSFHLISIHHLEIQTPPPECLG